MRRSWGYTLGQQQQQQGGETNSADYHDHLSKMIRSPSVLPDVPHYPSVHRVFNRSKVPGHDESSVENDEEKQPEPPKSPGHNKSSKQSPQFQEKVEVIEFKEEGQTTSSVSKKMEKTEVPGESVDSKANGHIQQRRQKFELCKWTTFKVH